MTENFKELNLNINLNSDHQKISVLQHQDYLRPDDSLQSRKIIFIYLRFDDK